MSCCVFSVCVSMYVRMYVHIYVQKCIDYMFIPDSDYVGALLVCSRSSPARPRNPHDATRWHRDRKRMPLPPEIVQSYLEGVWKRVKKGEWQSERGYGRGWKWAWERWCVREGVRVRVYKRSKVGHKKINMTEWMGYVWPSNKWSMGNRIWNKSQVSSNSFNGW